MAEVKWVKLTTDMFDNRKIKYLRKLPDGDKLVLIWVMLLTMAGRCNARGMIFITENIPYTTKSLADELDFEETTVKLALEAFAKLDMVIIDESGFCIAGWEEHQNAEALEIMAEQNRERQRRFKAKQKALAQGNVTANVTANVTERYSNAIDIDIESEEELEERNNSITNVMLRSTSGDVQRIVDAWNAAGLQPIRKITARSTREKQLKARIAEYSVDDVLAAIEKIKHSTFLRGGGKTQFIATFDWFLKPNNFPKVLEGNYDDHPGTSYEQTRNRLSYIDDWAKED